MYQIHLLKEWFIRNFLCVHKWTSREVGTQRITFCKKCDKFK